MCKATNSLPRAGGILDQKNRDIILLKAGLEALAEKERLDNKQQPTTNMGGETRGA